MTREDSEFVDQARGVAGRLAQMAEAHARTAAALEPAQSPTHFIAAGILIAVGNILDAVCDEVEARP